MLPLIGQGSGVVGWILQITANMNHFPSTHHWGVAFLVVSCWRLLGWPFLQFPATRHAKTLDKAPTHAAAQLESTHYSNINNMALSFSCQLKLEPKVPSKRNNTWLTFSGSRLIIASLYRTGRRLRRYMPCMRDHCGLAVLLFISSLGYFNNHFKWAEIIHGNFMTIHYNSSIAPPVFPWLADSGLWHCINI